jgi:hypothetical protein
MGTQEIRIIKNKVNNLIINSKLNLIKWKGRLALCKYFPCNHKSISLKIYYWMQIQCYPLHLIFIFIFSKFAQKPLLFFLPNVPKRACKPTLRQRYYVKSLSDEGSKLIAPWCIGCLQIGAGESVWVCIKQNGSFVLFTFSIFLCAWAYQKNRVWAFLFTPENYVKNTNERLDVYTNRNKNTSKNKKTVG